MTCRANSRRATRVFLLTTTTALTTVATLAGLATRPAHADPLGGTVVGGSATIHGQGTASVTINQTTENAVINWQTFNINQGEITTFRQPNSAAITLNRVIGGQGPSTIDGTLTANGHIFIINGDGILFGSHAIINTAGFLASTSDICRATDAACNQAFVKNYSGRYNFNIPGNPTASIVNQGQITATSGGFAALVAPGVRNAGTITATLGTVSLAAGNAYTLDFWGDRLITLALNDQIAKQVVDAQTHKPLTSLVSNDGTLSADGGRVELTAAAARVVVNSVINNTGVIEANSVGTRNGMIVLSAATGASKPAGAPTQTVKVSGTITAAGKAKGTTGGTVVVTGEDIQLTGAKIDASGDAGGGHVLIGGDTGGGHLSAAAASIELAKLETFSIPTATTVSVDAGTTINASATGSGNGGKVVIWSDQQTTFAGIILAQGGAAGGNGGFVETSSHGLLTASGTVNLGAPQGQGGNWLLDPSDVTIGNCEFAGCVAASSIANALLSGNVTVATGTGEGAGDISVINDLTWTSNNTLTLSAFRNINIGGEESVTISNTGTGNLILRADNTGTGNGTVNFNSESQINLASGTVSIYYNPRAPIDCECGTKYQNPTDYSGLVSGNLTAYMLVNNATDLGLVRNSAVDGFITGNFALGRNIDATGFGGMPDVKFNGLFDGNGGLGTNYTISNLTIAAPNAEDSYGLFGFIWTNGIVRNLNLANVTINAGADTQFLGALAGSNFGTISNVNVVSGTINGGSHVGIAAGGLVGQNASGEDAPGTITGSTANVTITLGNSTSGDNLNITGGLVASNLGTISNSSATGGVSSGTFSIVGGLVGQNGLNCDCDPSGPGSITASFATGNVSGSGNVQLGGLVGVNDVNSTIANSYATGNVTGTNLVSDSNGNGTASVGGFVGVNKGNGSNSLNNGTITNSYATGNVSVSGAVFGDFVAGGFVGTNTGTVQGTTPGTFTYARGNVTGGANSITGGFAGNNQGSITFAYASGNVQVGADSYAGGFFGGNLGSIFQAYATGTVTDDPGSVLGGFGAFNIGSLSQVFAVGAVTGGNNSVVGGLVAVNGALVPTDKFGDPGPVGSITDAYATGSVSGGTNSIAGGLVAVNDGVIKTSYSAGPVSGGSGSSTGGLAAQNNSSFQFSDKQIDSIVDQDGTPVPLQSGAGAISNSYWNTQTSGQSSSAGGTGLTSQQLASGLPPGFSSAVWVIQPDPSFPYFPWQPGNIPFISFPPNTPGGPDNPNPPSQPQIINNLTNNLTLVSLPPPVNVLPYPPFPSPSLPGPGPGPQVGGPPRLFAVPPPGETRYVKDEVLLMVDCDTPQSTLDTVAREMRLTITAQQCLMTTHLNLLRMHIQGGRAVADVVRALARYRVIAVAQANFIYQLMQDKVAQELAQDPDLAGRTQEGDAAQYALGKLGVIDIHREVKGTNISIAVIDSQIDVRHPDLAGVFADQYDAVGEADAPHPHGTGMAGAIAAHRRLMGIAPAARLFAIHAFSSHAASADSTTFSILKGLDWAATKGVRIINMSFAGPRDPSMERALKIDHDKGIVLIAAAGNAGPKSPPLFPGADPNVIAVTATDSNDKVFNGANRGKYIAVAAPGVDILVPAPDNTYQLTTGTSVSSAEVSGIAALLLERNPNLGPEDIRKILTISAKHPGAKERDDDVGSGLVDPAKAIQDAGEVKPVGQPARR